MKWKSQHRELKAIMYADIVSYTDMAEDDEPGETDRIQLYRRLLKMVVQNFDGRIVHFYGDGCLILMSSAYNAVRSAIRMQELFAKARIPIRIGIHIGNLITRQGLIHGDGFDTAAHLESIGWNGSILISKSLYEQINGHPDIVVNRINESHSASQMSSVIYAVSHNGNQLPQRKFARYQVKHNGKNYLT
jgi:class 3 adenylate cyclase